MGTTAWSNDRVFAVGMLVLSILLVVQSFRYPADSAQFPRFLSIVLLLLSALLAIRAARAGGRPEPPPPVAAVPRPAGVAARPALFVFLVTGLYILAIQWLGFLSASVAFMLACPVALGNRRWAGALLWGLFFPAGLYLLFHSLLRVHLPAGWLP
jgi:hypothetical protein